MALDSFPLFALRPVANAHNEWVALHIQGADGQAPGAGALQVLFGAPDLLAAVAPLDCIVPIDAPAILTPSLLDLLPPQRVLLAVRAQSLAEEGACAHLARLQGDGWRILLDGAAPSASASLAVRTVARDCSAAVPAPGTLSPLFGPHLAYGVDSAARFQACERAGFGWFEGDYALEQPRHDGDDGGTRKRLLTLLALLARDADARELEDPLKQDAALCHHLLKLVNSAAFSCGTEITSFAQAITRIGRRQLQRWLQLLLYARTQPDGPPNLLLPLAALRGALLEALCKRDGGDRDAQDQAFMAGAFSLLDRLFQMPLDAILADLPLPGHVNAALLRHEGLLGRRLLLAAGTHVDAAQLQDAGVDPASWWQARLTAFHWAIQVARNV